jgi:hypothetical protein
MNRLSLRNNQLKFKTSGKLSKALEEFRENKPPINEEKLKDVNM